MVRLVVAVIFALFAATCTADHHGHPFNEKYPFSFTLKEDSYYLYWNFSRVEETIEFGVRVKTEGWVGFGISPNGQMPGSDVVIGWVDGDRGYFHDRFAETRSLPPIDASQDWFLISSAINDGYTELEFTRNFTTCDTDNKDLDILPDTSRIVFSWNDVKPTIRADGTYVIAFHTNEGSSSINLLGGLPVIPTIPDNAKQFTVSVDQAALPDDDTTYWCRGISMASLIDNPDNARYIIKFGPSLTETSAVYVHHMLVYTCNELQDNTNDLGPGGPCEDQSDRIGDCRGGKGVLIAAWAIGGIDFVYPENVAFPIGGQDDHRYFVIEMHYNNPGRIDGIIDSSGISFTYLDEEREHDAGILFIGHHVSSRLAIPPKAVNYTVSGLCSGACTDEFLPENGITIFGDMLHTHLAGHGLSLSVLRPNSTGHYEQIKIDRNLKYDFNFQQAAHLPQEITVLPGDSILLDCFYNTATRTEATFGGESTNEEMCLAFPIYYPKIDMLNCQSLPTFNKIIDFVNQLPQEEQIAFIPLDDGISRTSLGNALNQVTWTDELIASAQNAIYVEGSQYSYCFDSNSTEVTLVTPVPTISEYHSNPAPVRSCNATETRPDGASLVHFSAIMVLIVTAVSLYSLFC